MVLLEAMGNFDGEWLCWPHMETIAEQVEQNIGSVRRHVARFEQMGLLERRPRGKRGEGGGGRNSNEFVLNVELLLMLTSDPQNARLLDETNRATDAEYPRIDEAVTAQSADPLCLIELPQNDHKNDTSLTTWDALCELLADRVLAHRGGSGRPKITEKWRRDMRLLIERGPLRVDDVKSVEPERVRGAIEFVFEHLADPTGADGFCWADQIRSPGALRDHWQQLRDAGKRMGISMRGRNATLIDAGRDGDSPSVSELLRRGSAIDATSTETRAIGAQ